MRFLHGFLKNQLMTCSWLFDFSCVSKTRQLASYTVSGGWKRALVMRPSIPELAMQLAMAVQVVFHHPVCTYPSPCEADHFITIEVETLLCLFDLLLSPVQCAMVLLPQKMQCFTYASFYFRKSAEGIRPFLQIWQQTNNTHGGG